MRKVFLPFLSILILLIFFSGSAAAASPQSISLGIFDAGSGLYQQIKVGTVALTFDGIAVQTDMPPFILNSRTMIPVRVMAEKLSAEVLWVSESNQVIILKGATTIVLSIGSPTAQVNGVSTMLPDGVSVGLAKYNNVERALVPLRFVSEQLGAIVGWDNDTYTASVAPPVTAANYDVSNIALLSNDGAVSIETSAEPIYNVIDFGNRVVIDLLDANLLSGMPATLTTSNDVISSVRYSQYNQNYEDHPFVVRIVLDLAEGVTYNDNITVKTCNTGIWVQTISSEPTTEPPVDPPPPSTDYSAFTVVLDPGHGGADCGAIYDGINEKDINLTVTQKVQALLKQAGVHVLLTRSTDTTMNLYNRAPIANNAQADIFVSIHSNANSKSNTVQGIYTCCYADDTPGSKLAETIQTAAISSAGAFDRGIQFHPDFVVLRETKMPAVLIEMGFMSTPDELARLIDDGYQQKLADGIAHGILNYLSCIK